MQQEVEHLRAKLNELKSSLASTSADKERLFQEKLELHQRINGLTNDRDAFLKVHLRCKIQNVVVFIHFFFFFFLFLGQSVQLHGGRICIAFC